MALKTGKILSTYDELNAGTKNDTVVVHYSRSEPAAIMIAKDASAEYKNKPFLNWGTPPSNRGVPGGGGGIVD